MKKGLLSLLALALTVVGCQNYDDQFDELTSQITSLQSTVDGLTGVSTAITSLQSQVAAITSALTGITSTVNGLSNYDDSAVVAQLGTISATLADLLGQLNGVATAADLATISNTLGDVQDDVRELLNANATISQAILINSSASLQYVESLIATGTDDPNVIVNNTVTIDTGSLTDAEKARANDVAAKIATVIGDVTITGDETITLSELTYVDGDYIVSGADHSEPKLSSITGDLIITQDATAAALSFGVLSSVTNIVAKGTTLATATSIDFSGVTVSGDVGTGTVTNTLTATHATGAVNLGTVDNFATINADKASSVTIGDTAAYPTALTINAELASTIDITAATSLGGALTIAATDSTVLNANSLTGTLSAVIAVGDLGTANLDGVAEITGTLGAEILSIAGLTHLGGSGTVDLDGITSLVTTAELGSNAVGTAAATAITISSFSDVDAGSLTDLGAAVLASLTVTAQSGQVSFTGGSADDLKTLHITLDGADTGVDVEVTGVNSLTHLTIAGTAREVNVNTNTGLVTLTTEGYINDFTAETLAALTSLDISHSYTTDFTRPFNFVVNDVDQITSLNLSSLNKVFNLFITGNAALASITAPANTIPITPDTLNGTIPNIMVTGNSIQATYTNAVATIPSDGINPQTDFVSSTIESASLSSIKDFIEANLAVVATTSYTLDFDSQFGSAPNTFDGAVIADCAGMAGPDNTIGAIITGSACTPVTGTASDDDDRGLLDGVYIDNATELALIN